MDMAMLIKIVKFYGRFTPSFSAIGYYARRPLWGLNKFDFHSQTWLVTGASGGIGRAIAVAAAQHGARVIAVARNEQKLAELVASVPPGLALETRTADLSLMSETAALVDRLQGEKLKINVLVNNVGALIHEHELTVEGKESSYALNILNHFLLTEKLIGRGLLKQESSIINMSSGGMYNAPLMVDRMNQLDPARYGGVMAYAVHKRGQAELTKYWQQKYGEALQLRCYVMHPGWTDTAGVRHAMPRFRKILRLVLRNDYQGADTAVWLAARRPEADPGAFWLDRKPRSAHAYPATRTSRYSPNDLAQYLTDDCGAYLLPN